MSKKNLIAFALGGLAGNNAYGAGFLHAALHCDAKPAMITCTSGQIYWVAEYLSCLLKKKSLQTGEVTSLSEVMRQQLSEQTLYGLLAAEMKEHLQTNRMQFPAPVIASFEKAVEAICTALPMQRDAVFSWLFWHGKDKRYSPALLDFTRDFLTNSVSTAFDIFSANMSGRFDQTFLTDKWLGIWPSRSLQPRFSPEFFQKIADLMNADEHGIGIAFNSYDARAGIENVYMNPRAMQLLGRMPGNPGSYRERTFYQEINADAVRAALWLYYYGFPSNMSQLDGAYYRNVILSEACAPSIRRIYAVRPIPSEWQGPLPQRLTDTKDFETEVGFNGAYIGELDKLELIQKLKTDFDDVLKNVGVSTVQPKVSGFFSRFQKIDVVPVELKLHRGFFDYLFESGEVFDAGFSDACRVFSKNHDCHRNQTVAGVPCPPPPGPPLGSMQPA